MPLNYRYAQYWMKEHPGVRAWIFGDAAGRQYLVKKGEPGPDKPVALLGVIE